MPERPLIKIFLSYNRQNQAFIESVAKRLKNNSSGQIKDVFFDHDNLGGGDNWVAQIQLALTDSDVCIVFIGEKGIGKWQNKEVLTAVSKHINTNGEFKIIPVIIPHSNRENVQKNFPWLLSDTQWIEFSNESDPDAFLKLVDSLRRGGKSVFPIPENAIPYKGLDFFNVEDAPFFFGRTFDLNWVFYKKLRLYSKTYGNRFLAIVGDSGSGKSSFARAGLLAALKAGRFTGSEGWKQVIFSPEDNPLLKLATSLQASGIINNAKEMEDEARNDNGALRRRMEVYGKKLVLFVDQFEEVITQCKDSSIQTSFLNNLTEGLKSEFLVCILTMRSDFYAAFAAFPVFADLIENNNYTLTGLDFQHGNDDWERYLFDIIQKPAKLAGVKFEDVLARQMLEDVKGINGILPALELALIQLWKNRKNKLIITSEDYDELAKGRAIGGIIEEHAEKVLELIILKNKDLIILVKAIFIRLVEITSNKEDVRKTIKKKDLIEELSNHFKDPEEIENILKELSGPESRLISIKKDSNKEDWVEVIHEVLIRQWKQLRDWLDNRREAITYKNYLEQYIDQDGTLFSRKKLAETEAWVHRNGDISNIKIADFVKKSRHQVNKRKSITIGSILFIGLACITVWIFYPTYKCYTNVLAKENHILWGYDALDELHSLTVKRIDHLKWVKCFSNLETLFILNNINETIHLSQSHLDLLPKSLQSLTITDFETDSSLNLIEFQHLRSLELIHTNNLRTLKGISTDNIHHLTLIRLYDLTSLTGIENITELETLELNNLRELNSLASIEKLHKLQSLILSSLETLTDLRNMDSLEELQSLKLNSLYNLNSLNGIENLKGLKSLKLNYLPDLNNLNGIDSLSVLDTLELFDLNSLTSLKGIENLKALKSLTISSLDLLTSLKGIENLKGLKSLKLHYLPDLTSLNGIDSLSVLDTLELFGLNSLTSLKGIENLKALKSFELICSYNRELGLQTHYFNLIRPNFTDLKALDSLQMLTHLDLRPLVTMRGIENLRIMFFPKL